MNKRLRKRKIKFFMKIAIDTESSSSESTMSYSKIKGNSWDEYRDLLSKSINEHWNMSAGKKLAEYRAIDSIIEEYTECFIKRRGLENDTSTSDAKKSQAAFKGYVDYYDKKLRELGRKAIKPSDFLEIIRQEDCTGPNTPEFNIDELEIVHNIYPGVSCETSKEMLSGLTSATFDQYNNIIDSSYGRMPKPRYICIEGITLETTNSKKNLESETAIGRIHVKDFNNLMLEDEYQERLFFSTRIEMKKTGGEIVSLDLQNQEDYKLFNNWCLKKLQISSQAFLIQFMTKKFVKIRGELFRQASGDTTYFVNIFDKRIPGESLIFYELAEDDLDDNTSLFINDEKRAAYFWYHGGANCESGMDAVQTLLAIYAAVAFLAGRPVAWAFLKLVESAAVILEIMCIFASAFGEVKLYKKDNSKLSELELKLKTKIEEGYTKIEELNNADISDIYEKALINSAASSVYALLGLFLSKKAQLSTDPDLTQKLLYSGVVLELTDLFNAVESIIDYFYKNEILDEDQKTYVSKNWDSTKALLNNYFNLEFETNK